MQFIGDSEVNQDYDHRKWRDLTVTRVFGELWHWKEQVGHMGHMGHTHEWCVVSMALFVEYSPMLMGPLDHVVVVVIGASSASATSHPLGGWMDGGWRHSSSRRAMIYEGSR